MEIYQLSQQSVDRVSKCDRGIIKRVHSCRAARASNISRTPITTKRLLIIPTPIYIQSIVGIRITAEAHSSSDLEPK